MIELKRKRASYAVTEKGIKVQRCCASCMHKDYDDDGNRICRLLDRRVPGKNRCERWQMSEAMQRVGWNKGGIKKQSYLMSVLAFRQEEDAAIDNGMIIEEERLAVKELRREFGEVFEIR